MKIKILLGLTLLLFTGCAQVFDGNLYSSVDKPNLSSYDLGNKSLTGLWSLMQDQSFLTALQSDDSSLSTVQTNLNSQYAAASDTPTKVKILQTYIIITGLGSKLYPVVNNVFNFLKLSNISGLGTSGSSLQSMLQSIFSGLSQSDIKAAMTQSYNVGKALAQLYTLAPAKTDFMAGLPAGYDGVIAQIGGICSSINPLLYYPAGGFSTLTASVNNTMNFYNTSDPLTALLLFDTTSLPAAFSTVSYELSGGTAPGTLDSNFTYLSILKSIIKP